MKRHFEDMIATRNAMIAEWLPQASSVIASCIPLDDLVRSMREQRDASPASASDRALRWSRLKQMSFCSAFSSIYAVSLLVSFASIQLNIIGRHRYLTATRGLPSAAADAEAGRGKHLEAHFLSLVLYFVRDGLTELIKHIDNAVFAHLRDLDVSAPLSRAQLASIFAATRETIEAPVSGESGSPCSPFRRFLLPRVLDAASWPVLAEAGSPGALAATSDPLYAACFALLTTELTERLSSLDCAAVLHELADMGVDMLLTRLGGVSEAEPVLLARVIPQLAAAASELRRGDSFTRAIDEAVLLRRYSALVYTDFDRTVLFEVSAE